MRLPERDGESIVFMTRIRNCYEPPVHSPAGDQLTGLGFEDVAFFPMHAQIQSFRLLLGAHPQSNQDIADF